jgi:hypothetical protein
VICIRSSQNILELIFFVCMTGGLKLKIKTVELSLKIGVACLYMIIPAILSLHETQLVHSGMIVNCHIILLIYWAGVELNPLLLRPLISLLYWPWMINDGDC